VGNIGKILIVELWGIGDAVMMSPILAPLREKFPEARISVLCQQHAADILKENRQISRFFIFKFPWTAFTGKYRFWRWDWKGIMRLIMELRREKFDLVLDARKDPRNNLLLFLTGGKRRVGYGWKVCGYFLTDAICLKDEKIHRVEAWKKLLVHLGIEAGDVRPDIRISVEEEKWAGEFLKNNGISDHDLMIGIHPGARVKVRCWPLEKFAEIGSYAAIRHKAKVLVFVEPDGYGDDIAVTTEHVKVKVGLRQMTALISKLSLLICNDSGAMHIASAVHTPTVSIFGPGDPGSIGPYGGNHAVVIKDISCRPCFDHCRYHEPLCLTGIFVEDVIREIDRKLQGLSCIKGLKQAS